MSVQQPLYVIFDGPPSHESGRFVEVETADGKGISAGTWENHSGKYWRLGPLYVKPQSLPSEKGTIAESATVATPRTDAEVITATCHVQADFARQLKRENAELRTAIEAWKREEDAWIATEKERRKAKQMANHERDGILEKLIAATKDAERYRWLRDKSAEHRVSAPSATLQDGHGVKVIWQSYGVDDRTKHRCVLFAEALDSAIDAAIKEGK